MEQLHVQFSAMVAEIGINLSDERSIVKPSSFSIERESVYVLKLDKGGPTLGELNKLFSSCQTS